MTPNMIYVNDYLGLQIIGYLNKISRIGNINEHWQPCWHSFADVQFYQLFTSANRYDKLYPAISTPVCQLDEDACLTITFSCHACSKDLLFLEVRILFISWHVVCFRIAKQYFKWPLCKTIMMLSKLLIKSKPNLSGRQGFSSILIYVRDQIFLTNSFHLVDNTANKLINKTLGAESWATQ